MMPAKLLAILVVSLPVLGCPRERPHTAKDENMWPFARRVSLQAQLEALRAAGITLNPGVMTGNALGLSEVKDHVDLEEGKTWIEFRFREARVHWDFRVDDDWLDPEILVRYDELLARSQSGIRIYSNHTDYGQSALLGAFRPEEKSKFDELVRIKMPPIAEQR